MAFDFKSQKYWQQFTFAGSSPPPVYVCVCVCVSVSGDVQ